MVSELIGELLRWPNAGHKDDAPVRAAGWEKTGVGQ